MVPKLTPSFSAHIDDVSFHIVRVGVQRFPLVVVRTTIAFNPQSAHSPFEASQ
jgi:hypothetical protein